MPYTLFLDDTREPGEVPDTRNRSLPMLIARSFPEALAVFAEHGCPDYVWFDHDLGPEGSGLDVANAMLAEDIRRDYGFIPPHFAFRVHSANAMGRLYIMNKVSSYLQFRRWDRETGRLTRHFRAD